MTILSFAATEWRYEPYPVGLVAHLLRPEDLAELTAHYPPPSLFKYMGPPEYLPQADKWSLSELNHPDQYQAFLRSSAPWASFYQTVKSPAFVDHVLTHLKRHHIDLGRFGKWSTRFEFACMPSQGGYLRPHTDSYSKIVTIVIPMPQNGEWDPAYGGATDIVRMKDPTRSFNWINDYAEFSDVETLWQAPYVANAATIFIKTHNSWHAVGPMTGPSRDLMRRTVTINLERKVFV